MGIGAEIGGPPKEVRLPEGRRPDQEPSKKLEANSSAMNRDWGGTNEMETNAEIGVEV